MDSLVRGEAIFLIDDNGFERNKNWIMEARTVKISVNSGCIKETVFWGLGFYDEVLRNGSNDMELIGEDGGVEERREEIWGVFREKTDEFHVDGTEILRERREKALKM
uniref:Uncharacterized protein n=1 Tax=Nelumbo nucifera TaxID=4432 RepID=A0A822ZRJ9_NELNU|nr:TPA_asm: hypothetical protein HUJ06_004381 [Nelumbo nucifera]